MLFRRRCLQSGPSLERDPVDSLSIDNENDKDQTRIDETQDWYDAYDYQPR